MPRFAEQLEREAVRLSRIVADLWICRGWSRAASSQDRVRLDAVVREESSRFEEAAIEAGLTDRCRRRSRARRSEGRGAISRCWSETCLDNAIRYTKSGRLGGGVGVGGRRTSVVLRVSDTGSGIPSKELSRVFERFYRVDRARSRETGGTGLGLAIVRHVAENHGGTVTVESELGRGSTFEVRLPSATADGNGSDGS